MVLNICDNTTLLSFFTIFKRILLLIQIFVPIILVVFASINIAKMVNNPDDKKGKKKILNQFIAAIIVFFVPLFVNVTMNLLGDNNDISSCWMKANDRMSTTNNYRKTSEKETNTIVPNPDEYEKGVPKPKSSTNSTDSTSSTSTTTSSTSTISGDATYGSFSNQHYVDANGTEIDYYLYLPDNNNASLPIHMYLHGSGETNGGVLNCGLPMIINNKEMNPSGIVICPQAYSTDDFYTASYQDALVGLTKAVASKYKGDINRVSISGHSMGAIAGYQLIGRNPGYFSAFVPISGVPSNLEEVKRVNVWAFHGSLDEGCDYGTTVEAINYLKSSGANAHLHTFEGEGHGGVQNYTFQSAYEDSTGEMINPLEWAFKQKK